MYLLDETPEAQEMRQNVLQFLQTYDKENLLLALQLMKKGGVHKAFVGTMLAHYLLTIDNKEHQVTKILAKLLSRVIPLYQLAKLKRNCKNWYYIVEFLEDVTKRIEENKYAYIRSYWRGVLSCLCVWKGFMQEYCFQHNIVPAEIIVEKRTYNNVLRFNEFDLKDLSAILAVVQVERVILLRNPFSQIKRKKWQNLSVKYLDIEYTELPRRAARILGMCFPKVCERMWRKEPQAMPLGYLQSLPKEKRDMKFYKFVSKAYIQEGKYALAIKIYELLEKQYPYPEEGWKLRIAECYAYLQDEDKMLQYLASHIEETPFDAIKDITYSPAFDAYRETEEVKRLKVWCENLKARRAFLAS